MKKIFILLLLYMPFLYAQQNNPGDKPPLRNGKVAVELAVSAATGAGLALASMYIYAKLNNDNTGWDQLAGTILVGGLAYPVGNTIGAYYAGNSGNERGSFWATLGGSAAGAAIAVSVIAITNVSELGILYFILPPIGAVVGHNLTRRWASPPGNALLNFQDGQFYAGVPSVQLIRDFRQKNSFSKQFHIISIQF